MIIKGKQKLEELEQHERIMDIENRTNMPYYILYKEKQKQTPSKG